MEQIRTPDRMIEQIKAQNKKENKNRPLRLTYHSKMRLEERFKVFGATMYDIKKDIIKAKRHQYKDGHKIVYGDLGTYILSKENDLITLY